MSDVGKLMYHHRLLLSRKILGALGKESKKEKAIIKRKLYLLFQRILSEVIPT